MFLGPQDVHWSTRKDKVAAAAARAEGKSGDGHLSRSQQTFHQKLLLHSCNIFRSHTGTDSLGISRNENDRQFKELRFTGAS